MMYFSSWQDVLQMQGHGIYVWPAYGISLGILLVFVLMLRSRTKKILRKLSRQMEAAQQNLNL